MREFFQTKILEYKPFIAPSDLHLQDDNEEMVNGKNDDGFNWVNIHIDCKNSRWQDLTMGYKSSWDRLVYKWS